MTDSTFLPPNPQMIDLVKKKNDLLRQIKLATEELSDLVKRKRQLEIVNADLDRKSVQKMGEVREIVEQIKTLREKVNLVSDKTTQLASKEG